MQPQGIKLREIIWEVTGACKNGCSYCGSKECWNEVIDEDRIKLIVNAISLYPPTAIDISGGDPLLVSLDTHRYIKEMLKDKAGVMIKVLVNPKSLYTHDNDKKEIFYGDNVLKILDLYDWIGLSINTEEELKQCCCSIVPSWLKKCTVITNFNLSNIFLYSAIEEFIKNNNLSWQIQMTMYKAENSEALYSSEHAIELLSLLIQKSLKEGVKVIPADNINGGSCGAGTSCIGILSSGIVVPCLSMRSWKSGDEFEKATRGNILDYGLEAIWENSFDDYRFKPFKCCKDYSGNVDCLQKVIKEKPIVCMYLVSIA